MRSAQILGALAVAQPLVGATPHITGGTMYFQDEQPNCPNLLKYINPALGELESPSVAERLSKSVDKDPLLGLLLSQLQLPHVTQFDTFEGRPAAIISGFEPDAPTFEGKKLETKIFVVAEQAILMQPPRPAEGKKLTARDLYSYAFNLFLFGNEEAPLAKTVPNEIISKLMSLAVEGNLLVSDIGQNYLEKNLLNRRKLRVKVKINMDKDTNTLAFINEIQEGGQGQVHKFTLSKYSWPLSIFSSPHVTYTLESGTRVNGYKADRERPPFVSQYDQISDLARNQRRP